ncbi:hypothetical protein TPHA_0E02020 [Tetrapisispora phaffii CBS 4417]|uniref:Carnitine O-acetyltransferase, mitochondrial n=1 Tax=Tetrapisispora phaffii (strain ATCC 24235 / CBS 4417 / NBRC 1672 / NRRL Y-8282 / UCD 70-5) TaxID=1071381 RepID=G8BTR6_TETPH|nr:hypothetical protein TPHA_0E02020 [Tetrapisispora phaffii CBS 4417]CCE63294.1 hypothetical protein TPHA_0E02020 [Tetrapisispora phaffii CBS 4417]
MLHSKQFANTQFRRTMTTAKQFNNNLKRFEFKTKNNEYYLANNSNEYYQKNIYNNTFRNLTYSKQDILPDLPIPELETTVKKYLKSIKPFLQNNESEYNLQKLKCKDLLENMGPILQKRLIEYKNSNSYNKRNWLSTFWDKQAYLNYNDPVVPYVSYFYSHKNITNQKNKFIENDYLLKSTAIIKIISDFIESLKNESVPFELIKGSPFCMNSFQLMFNTSRIPDLDPNSNDIDTNVFYSIYENNFIIVICKGNFYKLWINDEKTLKPLSVGQIYQQLLSIVESVNKNVKNDNIGILTSLPRDEFKKSYETLIKNPQNKDSLDRIHKSAFILCLDTDVTAITLEEKSRNAWHGDGYNRYFDKALQFIVAKNGASGCLNEHSKMDGTPTLFLNSYLCNQLNLIDSETFLKEIKESAQQPNISMETNKLQFQIEDNIKNQVVVAKTKFDSLLKEHDLKVWHYNRYGKSTIKKHKFSPDAFIQQIIQLAVFKYTGKVLPTYEAASTRKFFKGRTETGRSVTSESELFVKNWNNPKLNNNERIQLLRNAAAAHSKNLGESANGQGIDRHFFGLKNMVDEKKDNMPELFSDKLFNYSSTWLISTSQLSSEYFDGYGWSQVNDKGFGLAYMLNTNWLHINIVNKPDKANLSCARMHYYLSEAADEIMDILENSELENIALKSKY